MSSITCKVLFLVQQWGRRPKKQKKQKQYGQCLVNASLKRGRIRDKESSNEPYCSVQSAERWNKKTNKWWGPYGLQPERENREVEKRIKKEKKRGSYLFCLIFFYFILIFIYVIFHFLRRRKKKKKEKERKRIRKRKGKKKEIKKRKKKKKKEERKEEFIFLSFIFSHLVETMSKREKKRKDQSWTS